MNIELRILLIAASVLTMVFFLWQIRAHRLQIQYAISWSLFSLFLLLLSIFPSVVSFTSELLGFQSPAGFIYVLVIFILLIKQFTATIKLSEMDRKIVELTQYNAIRENQNSSKKTNGN
ncbi:MAG: DUF2304 domain-containing protein [Clostridiales Family XIII bacterium]|nr:DUF2304 domain-containing protein [Clostridiales Family XIII bacterium]